MKHLLLSFLLLIANACAAQKYVLIDKKMSMPISYTNKVTLEQSYKNLFAVEKSKIRPFIAELEKIAAILSDKNKAKPETFDVIIGKTRIIGLKIPLAAEERLDVVISTDCDNTSVNMHLSDAKLSNANNAYFITTWIKYIKESLK